LTRRAVNGRGAVRKVGVLGQFGYGNLGDAAIQEAMIGHIREHFPQAEVVGFSLNPADTEQRHGIRSYPISRTSWADPRPASSPSRRLAIWLHNSRLPAARQLERWALRLPLEFGLLADAYRNLGGLNHLIISGGGQLDDYWGGGGPWSMPYMLLKFASLARLRGIAISVVSVGAGPVEAPLSRLFLRLALALAGYRSYRDAYSLAYVRDVIGYKGPAAVFPDLAFSLPVDRFPPRMAPSGRPLVGIGPLGYFREGSWPKADAATYAAYLDKLTDFVGWLLDRSYAVTFIPGEAKHDAPPIADLRQCLEQRIGDPGGALVANNIQTVSDLLAVLARLHLVCAARFHTIVLSQLAGVPALALSYNAKIDALMQDTGQARYCLPIDHFDLNTLKARFLELEANRERVRQEVDTRSRQYRAALEQQYEQLFTVA